MFLLRHRATSSLRGQKISIAMPGPATRIRLLIIDDSADFQLLVKTFLQDTNFFCLSAGDALQATGIAVREKPRVILLDIGLPGGDGVLLLESLRANTHTKTIPIIVATSQTAPGLEAKVRAKGAAAFLQEADRQANIAGNSATGSARISARPDHTPLIALTHSRTTSPTIWLFLWILYVCLIAASGIYHTNFVAHGHWEFVKWIPPVSEVLTFGFWSDIVVNVLLYVPFALLYLQRNATVTRSLVVRIMLLGLCLSCAVEFYPTLLAQPPRRAVRYRVQCHRHVAGSDDPAEVVER